jgi:NADPH-dependent curcumin reductase CurA
MTSGSNERTNRQVLLKKVPTGISGPDDFEVKESVLAPLGDGEVLVESHYFGVDAALRLIVRDSDEFLFRVKPGDIVRGSAAGRVIESNNPKFSVGDHVLASGGVQNFIVSNGDGMEKVDVTQAPLGAWLGGFGVSGLTAYFAVTEECKPQPGQTVLINGAAGAVGSIAGQLCKLAGATVIGLTGSAEKCLWLVEELGYDIAINYKDDNWYEQLVDAAPERLDVIFDNVGGSILDESMRLIGMHGVVLLCGSTSQYTEEEMSGPSNYIWLGTMRARMQGFVIFDYAERYAEARARMATWIKDGRLKLPSYEIAGDVDVFPEAFQQLYEGKNLGKMLLKLPAAE